jgi:hypothetical protein
MSGESLPDVAAEHNPPDHPISGGLVSSTVYLQQLFATGAALWQLMPFWAGDSFSETGAGVAALGAAAQQLMPAGFVFGVAGLSRPAIAALEATAAMITAARRVSLIFMEGFILFLVRLLRLGRRIRPSWSATPRQRESL